MGFESSKRSWAGPAEPVRSTYLQHDVPREALGEILVRAQLGAKLNILYIIVCLQRVYR